MRLLNLGGLVAALALGTVGLGETIEQGGSLSGGGEEPQTFEIELDQFDSMDGTRRLQSIRLDLLTSTIGGGSANGSGTPVNVFSHLSADYYLGEDLLADTDAIIDTVIANTSANAFTLFNTDTVEVVIDPPIDTSPWVGSGTITMTAIVELTVSSFPADEIDFSAGGSVSYNVIYEYEPVAMPGDVNRDGTVNVVDLLDLILAWGDCTDQNCPEDVDGNGTVNVTDLVLVILNWS